MCVSIKNLTKVFGAQRAVDDISFSISKGEIVGFLGPNGAGKSTTMKMITGYLEPESGEVSVCGIDVLKEPLNAKKKIGYLPESNALYYDMYVKEYLDFIADIHFLKNKKKKIDDVISLTALTPERNKKIGQLSKGYKQRVGLAASLIHNPEVLVLDEPTSGLDPNQIIEIREVIKDQGTNKVVLFSSHILQEVEAICNRVIIINKGKIVADDLVANLQKISSANIVKVSFKEILESELLNRLDSSIAVDQIDPYSWNIKTGRPDNLRRQLMELALLHNLNIVSLQNENQSLEEVFRNLTGNSKPSAE